MEQTKKNKYGLYIVKVRCDCGKEEERGAHALVQGHGRSCEFCRSKIKPGQKYGKLLILDFPEKKDIH